MKRLIHLLLFTIWLVGAVTGGVSMEPAASGETARFVSDTAPATLAVYEDQVVLTVNVSARTRWQLTASAPGFLVDWLRDSDWPGERPPSQTDTTVVPLFTVANLL